MLAIAYSSLAAQPFDEKSLISLSEQAAKENQGLQVSGYLYYGKGQFFQYIEGETKVLGQLMEKIRMDQRHKITTEIADGQLTQRRFPGWTMQYLSQDAISRIRLEEIIQMHFHCLESHVPNEERWSTRLWATVDRIAELQEKLSKVSHS